MRLGLNANNTASCFKRGATFLGLGEGLWRGSLNGFYIEGCGVEEAMRELFEFSKRLIPVREKEARRDRTA